MKPLPKKDYLRMRMQVGMVKYQLGEKGPKYPTMSKESLQRVLRSIITVKGRILDQYAFGEDSRDLVLYLVEIPIGSEKDFEEMTGYTLSSPQVVVVNWKINELESEFYN